MGVGDERGMTKADLQGHCGHKKAVGLRARGLGLMDQGLAQGLGLMAQGAGHRA